MHTDHHPNPPQGQLHIEIVDASPTDASTIANESYVFLHGLGGTHRYWTAEDGAGFLPPGSALVDLFGFGDSPRPLTRYTLDKHLETLEIALAGRPPFVLVGHSLGAAIAVAYAKRHPDDVKRLVLLSLPAYEGRQDAVRSLRHKVRGWFFTNMVLSVIVCIGIRRLLGPVLPFVIRDVPRQVARDLVEHNFMSSTTSLWNVLYRRDVWADTRSLREGLPVVLIHGTDDATAPIDHVRSLVDERRDWLLVELDGVDHHPWLRQPAACADAIADVGSRVG